MMSTFRLIFFSCVLSGETLFKDALVKAANNALGHLKNGCVGDPDPRKVHLFHLAGRTKDGLDKVRSARGTNRNEGYHQRLLQLLGAYNTSPLLAHYVLLLHNYRRNHRMAGKLSFCRLNWYLQAGYAVFANRPR